MINFDQLPNPDLDSKTHINTHNKAKTMLGRILSPQYEIGEPLHHPLLGPFRSVENMWCYLNTGGKRDRIRTMEPHVARNFARLSDKYSCDKFRELILDTTILKLQAHSDWHSLMADETLPFDHYYLKDVPIRPSFSELYCGILEEVRQVFRGEKLHEFVRFKDMNFEKLPDKAKK
jgi:hypothetical protein